MKNILFFTLFALILNISQAQNLEGRKIINGNLNANLITGNGVSDINISTAILYGKIKKDNTYWAFGGHFNAVNITDSRKGFYSFGPSVERGKFVKIIDKLYLAPYINGFVSAIIVGISGFSLNTTASPIRFMYNFSEHLMLSAGFGSANIGISSIGGLTSVNVGASLTNNSTFGVFYTF